MTQSTSSSDLNWTVTDGESSFLFQSFTSALAYADGLARTKSVVKVIDTKSNTIHLNEQNSTKWPDLSGNMDIERYQTSA
jgi:hypothetical protein